MLGWGRGQSWVIHRGGFFFRAQGRERFCDSALFFLSAPPPTPLFFSCLFWGFVVVRPLLVSSPGQFGYRLLAPPRQARYSQRMGSTRGGLLLARDFTQRERWVYLVGKKKTAPVLSR